MCSSTHTRRAGVLGKVIEGYLPPCLLDGVSDGHNRQRSDEQTEILAPV